MNKEDIIKALLELGKTEADLKDLKYNELRALLKATKPAKEKKSKEKKPPVQHVNASQAQTILCDKALAKIKDGYEVDACSPRAKRTFGKHNSGGLLEYMVNKSIDKCVCMKSGRPPAVFAL